MAHYTFQTPDFATRFKANPDELFMDFYSSYIADNVCKIQWRVYFKRHVRDNTQKEYISAYLKLLKFFDRSHRSVSCRGNLEVTYSIGIRDDECQCVHSKSATHNDWGNDWGWREFLPLEALDDYVLPDGSLFVFCNVDVRQAGRHSIPPSPPALPCSNSNRRSLLLVGNSFYGALGSLGERLLNDKCHMDVTITAGEKNTVNFQAHKSVLSIQSPVFALTFDHNKYLPDLPVGHSHLRIKDFDGDTVREMLTYIYTGHTDKLTEMAHLLLPAAEKYQLEGLKDEAVRELMYNMTTKNVVNTLLLADKHSIVPLKQKSLDYISTHGNDVTDTDDWKKLTENAELMTAVFKATAAKVPAFSYPTITAPIAMIAVSDWEQ
ncbi:PREDICTED: speckle-type POZ protein A-like [Priapulus caudatus]|uniref:Speckle-type POZ protein A-like n=1 Tax=Priapulus caudatus TaxID=37621 RepID=A0ABM1DS12_PRICU|nr:PREDICTED: speckle-type POZ protein A-like [Priapulus caudatus]